MKDAVATMGDVLPADAGGRDAVHVAVISAVAAHTLKPGQHVGFSNIKAPSGEGFAITDADKSLGIVDPFIKRPVRPEERFWLYIYPRTITGLNHQWSHPDLPDEAQRGDELYSPPSQKLASEKWIKDWAEPHGVTCRDMIAAAEAFIKHGAYLCRGGDLEGVSVPDEFWEHFERVTGQVVKTEDKGSFFTCSC